MNIDYKRIAEHTDLTNLSVTASFKDIDDLCKCSLDHGTASVCIAPCWVTYVKEKYPTLRICTVIGFPNGYSTTATKIAETSDAISNGADEIDMVVNQCWVNGNEENFKRACEEISKIARICIFRGALLKVIFEICNMEDETIKKLSEFCNTCEGVNYVKTSTGFGKSGADTSKVAIMREYAPNCMIKAAGGIRTPEAAWEYLTDYGCDRIGASSAKVFLSK